MTVDLKKGNKLLIFNAIRSKKEAWIALDQVVEFVLKWIDPEAR